MFIITKEIKGRMKTMSKAANNMKKYKEYEKEIKVWKTESHGINRQTTD